MRVGGECAGVRWVRCVASDFARTQHIPERYAPHKIGQSIYDKYKHVYYIFFIYLNLLQLIISNIYIFIHAYA